MQKFLVLAVAGLCSATASAQLSLTSLGTPVAQDFNTLPTTGTPTWTNNVTAAGVFYARTGTGLTIVANDGASNAGNLYSYGTGTTTDRALGSLGSGNAAAGSFFYGIRLQNNTGSTISSLAISYVGEQWRNGGAATPTVQSMTFSYLVGAPVTGTLAEFQLPGTPVAALNFSSPINNVTAATLDGNAAANRTAVSSTITGLNIPNGSEIMLRWSDPDHPGSDHGLSIDDFSVTPSGCAAAPVVSNTNDSGAGSLRAAIAGACAGATVTFDSSFGSAQTITLTGGELVVPVGMTITGPGADLLTISGNNASRVLSIGTGTVQISGLTLSGGNSVGAFNSGFGGAIGQFGGTLTVNDVVISGNTCTNTGAGIVSAFSTLTLNRVEIADNVCDNVAGLVVQDGVATISNSLISDNSGTEGDGIRVTAFSGNATLDLINSTISNHSVSNNNSAIRVTAAATRVATARLLNSTITDNHSTSGAGQAAIRTVGAGTTDLLLTNTIVIGNTANGAPADIFGTANPSSSFNLIGVGGGLVNGSNGNIVGLAPAAALLSDLLGHGGPTRTHALLPGSPAINAGGNVGAPAADQRGISRPQQGTVDIGAFESQGFSAFAASGNNQSTTVNSAFTDPLRVQIQGVDPVEPVEGGQVSFTPPGSGASAVLTSSPATVINGAALVSATANGTAGGPYFVGFNARGVAEPGNFALTNLPGGAPVALQFSAPTYSVNENGVSASITVTATPAPAVSVTVDYATGGGGTATVGSDYTMASGSLNFGVGVTTQSFTVPISNDSMVETNETVNLSLSNPTGGATLGALSTAVLTIVDDDVAASSVFTIANASLIEGNAGSSNLQFTVTAAPAPAVATTVDFASSSGTAASGIDFTPSSGTLNFGIGVATQTVTVPITGDLTVEANETLTVTLSNPTAGATVGAPGSATGTINNDDSAVISINTPAVLEGNTGTSALTFLLSISNPVQGAVSLSYASADGNNGNPLLNATLADLDYVSTSGTVSFPSDSTANLSVNLSVNGDTEVEPNQGLRLLLSNLTGPVGIDPAALSLASATGNGSITNDDGNTVSVAPASVSEGNAGTVNLAFALSLSSPSKTPVTVNYSTSPGTATSGTDFTATSGTATFPPGNQSQIVNVPVVGELIVEANETLSLTLSAPNGAILSTDTATGTINNDDSATLSLNSVAQAEGNAGNSPLSFTATLSNPVEGTVTASVSTADGNNGNALLNATVADNDYVAVSNAPLSIVSGTTASTAVQIVGDTDVEPNQAFRLILSNLMAPAGIPAGAITLGMATGTGTINNDDGTTLSIANASIVEGNAGTSVLNFTVSLSSPNKDPVSASFATSNGTATAGSDYVASSGTVSFPANGLSQTIAITINGDTQLEADETFTLTLSAPVGATLGTASATGTLQNDDSAALSVADATVQEGSGGSVAQLNFVVSLSGASSGPITVQYATSNGSANAGLDYTPTSGTLTFAPGESSKTVSVPVAPDLLPEASETISFTLSNPSPAQVTLSRPFATGTITDDDLVTQIPVNDWRALLGLLVLLASVGMLAVRRR